MNVLIFSLLTILGSASLLLLSPSLPLQALALLVISGVTAFSIACNFSILLGVYTILIYASGLLVLLAYFVALSPDQTLNSPTRSTTVCIALTASLILFFSDPFSSITQITPTNFSFNNVITILTPDSATLLIIIALILVLTMIAVVNVSSLSSGPVRPWSS